MIRLVIPQVPCAHLVQGVPVIFGFSHFPVGAGNTSKQTARKTTQTGVPLTVIESRTPAQIYDLAHQRRLKALQFYIEKGYPLNVAARLVEAAQ